MGKHDIRRVGGVFSDPQRISQHIDRQNDSLVPDGATTQHLSLAGRLGILFNARRFQIISGRYLPDCGGLLSESRIPFPR